MYRSQYVECQCEKYCPYLIVLNWLIVVIFNYVLMLSTQYVYCMLEENCMLHWYGVYHPSNHKTR